MPLETKTCFLRPACPDLGNPGTQGVRCDPASAPPAGRGRAVANEKKRKTRVPKNRSTIHNLRLFFLCARTRPHALSHLTTFQHTHKAHHARLRLGLGRPGAADGGAGQAVVAVGDDRPGQAGGQPGAYVRGRGESVCVCAGARAGGCEARQGTPSSPRQSLFSRTQSLLRAVGLFVGGIIIARNFGDAFNV